MLLFVVVVLGSGCHCGSRGCCVNSGGGKPVILVLVGLHLTTRGGRKASALTIVVAKPPVVVALIGNMIPRVKLDGSTCWKGELGECRISPKGLDRDQKEMDFVHVVGCVFLDLCARSFARRVWFGSGVIVVRSCL